MSTFATVRFTCPSCGSRSEGEVGIVVELARRPDLEAAILERRLNVIPCACGARNEVVRTVVALDFRRRLWVVAWPGWAEVHWRDLAHATRDQFRRTLGADAPDEVARWRVRAVFGYEALREKLVLDRADLDDRAVEIAKGKLLAGRVDRIGARVSIDAVLDDTLVIRVVRADGSHEVFGAPRTLLDPGSFVPGIGTVTLAPAWTGAELDADPFVSFRRWVVSPRPADPLAFDLQAVSPDRGQQRLDWDDG